MRGVAACISRWKSYPQLPCAAPYVPWLQYYSLVRGRGLDMLGKLRKGLTRALYLDK